jgi:hypothetical protein
MRSQRRDGLERLVDAVVALRRRVGFVYVASAVTLVAAVVLLLSIVPADLREGRGSPWPLLLALLLAIGIALGTVLYRRIRGELTPPRLAPEADRAAGLGEGDVLAALELAGPKARTRGDGISSLAGLHRRRVAEGLAGLARDRVLPVSASRWRRRAMRTLLVAGGVLFVLVVSVVARPGATYSAATALGAPWRTAFPAPLVPLEVRLEDTVVARGHRAVVLVRAPGRSEVNLVWQVTGEPSRRQALAVDGEEASGSTDPITARLHVWAEDAGGGASDTLIVRPVEPLLVQDLRATITYPAYLGRGGEVHRGRIPPLVVPEGTRISLAGEANHPLDDASLEFGPLDPASGSGVGERMLSFALAGRRFSGELWPTSSGQWTWKLESAGGTGTPIVPEPLDLVVILDARPDIRLLFPAPDTLLGPDAIMPLVLDIEDDLGLLRAELVWWRSAFGGGPPSQRRTALSPDPDGQKRAIFRPILDLRDEDLLPGDTIFYRVLARDGHPRRGPTQSATFLLRVPTLAELRTARADESEAIAEDAQQLSEAAEELERSAADAERRARPEGQAEAGARPGELGFEETEEARGILEQAEGMQDAIQELEDDLQALQEDIRESVLADPALEEQLAELAERYQELLDAGLAERIEDLSRALRDLDSDAVREALENMSGQAEWLREQIEQTLGLLERAALDQAVEAARAETDQLAGAQRDAAQDRDAPPGEWAADEERLADDADSLANSLDELAQRLAEAGQEAAGDSADMAGARADQAADAMREAAAAASASENSTPGAEAECTQDAARQAAEEAAQALEQAASALDGATDQLSGREDAVESLGRARAEALSLADAETDLAEAARAVESVAPETWRARQAAVRQGLENLLSTLSEDGSRSSVLDREIGTAAGEAAEQMDQLLERMTSDGGRRLPSRSDAEGIVDALNELAARLIASERAAQASQEQAGQEAAAEQMTSLAQQQQGVTQRTSTLLVPGPKPSGEERATEVARQQQEIAEQLRELDDPQNDLLGRPEELAREAEEIARRIESGRASPETVERQRTLFRRMLDAGRSLEDEDLDPSRRESETGRAVPRPAPEIDPALLRGVRFPLPKEALLRDLPLFYRRLIFDYFDRINRGSGGTVPPADTGSGDDGTRR